MHGICIYKMWGLEDNINEIGYRILLNLDQNVG